MCTSIRLGGVNSFFGRNMDIECSFGEHVVLVPRKYPISFKLEKGIKSHYAILGMASVACDYPLFADAFNEKGLCVAGLSFAGCAEYMPLNKVNSLKKNIAPYELPLLLLSSCKTVEECKTLLENINIVAVDFSDIIKLTPLHWHVADKTCSIVIECFEDHVFVKDNCADVLTNAPTFKVQMNRLASFQNLTPYPVSNCLSELVDVTYGKGLGGVGLPGDFSSQSRFVKSAYLTSLSKTFGEECITLPNLFAILSSVAVPLGAVVEDNSKKQSHYTRYTCGIDMNKLRYSYRPYDRLSITSIDMMDNDVDMNELIIFPF